MVNNRSGFLRAGHRHKIQRLILPSGVANRRFVRGLQGATISAANHIWMCGITRRKSMVCASNTTHRSEEHTSELQSHHDLVCRLLLEKKKKTRKLTLPS